MSYLRWNYGLHGSWYCENGNQFPYDLELAKLYSQDKLEYCLTCNTSSNKLKFAIQSVKPSLKNFLDFRLQEGDLEREETEHSRHKGELNTILKYHAEAPEISEEVQQMLRNFQLFVEQEELQKKIRSFIPTDKCSENLREWLHLPDDDISLVTEEDMDEIFMM
ncbi:5446_t:CDS:2 [Acaulospora colombiana]|uniref:5446_t:CDS:1 n=1 Tax=Acaulospora colombiana TaxID=27376 RepID=A0ACA9MHS1_9GLOM|nr:5446_t:CDS:2 [Acaulospora colombiana]